MTATIVPFRPRPQRPNASIREMLTADPSRSLSEKQAALVERLLAKASGWRR
jgi:hypothetical protein